jgi:hypothetical protein
MGKNGRGMIRMNNYWIFRGEKEKINFTLMSLFSKNFEE